MVLKKDVVLRALAKMRESSKKRNFVQSIDFTVNFKGLDFKKPESKIEIGVKLPFPVRKQKGASKALVFVDDKSFAKQIEAHAARIIFSEDISKLSKSDVEKLLAEFDSFFAQGPAMLEVGKNLGQILAPRGRMPRLVSNSPAAFLQEMQTSSEEIKVSNKKAKPMPLVHAMVGKESDEDEKIAQNIIAIYDALVSVLPAKEQGISNSIVKFTMGPPVKIDEKTVQSEKK